MAAKGKVNATKKAPIAAAKKQTKKKQTTAAADVEAKNKTPIAAAGKKGPTKTKSKSARLLEWEEREKLILVEGWARDGLSEKQIAHNMGCAYSTFKEWKKLSSALSAALKKGKEVSDYMVENALFNSAITGNVVAQIFWLKNRKPSQWQDKVEPKLEHDTEESGGVVMLAPRLEADNE